MPIYLPSKDYAKTVKLSHPIEKNLWDPNEFTFDGLRKTLTTLKDETGLTTVSVIKRLLMAPSLPPIQTAALTFPVCFSPSHAVKVAQIAHDAGVPSAVFLFESTSPTYKFDDTATYRAMNEISNMGFDLGIALGIPSELKIHDIVTELKKQLDMQADQVLKATHKNARATVVTYQTTGIKNDVVREVADRMEAMLISKGITSPYHAAFQDKSRLKQIRTSNGIYKDGHPVHGFMNSIEPYGVIQLIPEWFSEKPLFPAGRLNELPEVQANWTTFKDLYLDRVKVPTLGTETTLMHVSGISKLAKAGYQTSPYFSAK